jgi:hypothetical protein
MLFGPVYFATHGASMHAFLDALAVFTCIGHIVYAFNAQQILRKRYLAEGWIAEE